MDLGIVVLIAVLLNIAASVFLARRKDLDKTQKTFQIVIVWLIPFLAAIGLWLLNRSHDDKTGAEPKAFGGGNLHKSNRVYGRHVTCIHPAIFIENRFI